MRWDSHEPHSYVSTYVRTYVSVLFACFFFFFSSVLVPYSVNPVFRSLLSREMGRLTLTGVENGRVGVGCLVRWMSPAFHVERGMEFGGGNL